MRILSYNVRYFGHRWGGLTSQDRTIQDVARAIANLQGGVPEILCFQEIETQSLRADLGRSSKNDRRPDKTQLQRFLDFFEEELRNTGQLQRYHAFYYPAHVYRLGTQNLYTTGLATLVHKRFRVLAHNADTPCDITHRRIERLARWKQTRVCGHVRVWHPDEGILDLFNTHLSLPAFLTRDILSYTHKLGAGLNQLQEAKHLLGFIEATRIGGGGTLLVGDFNSLPGSPVWARITQQHHLVDVLRQPKGHQLVRSSYLATAGVAGIRLPIDYIFSSDRIDWFDFQGTYPVGSNLGPFHGLSDHVPLIARFKAREPVCTKDPLGTPNILAA